MALCFSGLSNTIVPMPSATVARSCSHPVSITGDASKQSREADVADAKRRAPGRWRGIRVVDLTRARAGPTCVRQLADSRCRRRAGRRPARRRHRRLRRANLQRNKRSVALDLHHPDGSGRVPRARRPRRRVRREPAAEREAPARHRARSAPRAQPAPRLRQPLGIRPGPAPTPSAVGLDQVAQGMGGRDVGDRAARDRPVARRHRDQRHRVGHVPHPRRARGAVRARAHGSRAVGAHVAARVDGQPHGLPGLPLAHRR